MGRRNLVGILLNCWEKKKKEGKKPNRSRVQISQGLGKQNKDIESNVNTKEGFSALDDDSRLEYDDLIPMWDKLGRTRDIKNDPQPNQEKGQSEFGGVFGCFKARRIFSNRNHDGEKKPFLGSKEKKRPLLENDSRSKNNGDASVSTRSTQSTQSTEDSEDEIVIKNEMKEVFKLAGPWTVVSVVSYSADFLLVLIISHFMGNAAMITYSTVWFILDFFNIISGGLYGSCYKHVNNAIADGSNHLAGEYMQISIIFNTIISVPACIAAVCFMETITAYYGYTDEVINMSASYATIAAISYVLEGNLAMAGIVLDIDGYAKFNAVWGLWESLGSIILTIIFIIVFEPSLLALGFFHFIEGLIMSAVYCHIVWVQKGWLDPYIDGLTSVTAIQNVEARTSLIKRSIPLLLDAAVASIEWFILSLFAAYQGAAEAVVWILLAYIWAIIEVIPESYAEAVSSRVAYNLSAGNVDIAGYLSAQSLLYGTGIAVVLSIPLLIFRNFIVWCISVDEVLEEMLLALLPYIALCQPFITLGMVATSLNEALCLYQHAVKIMLATTCLVTLPAAAAMTFVLGFNIEGLAAAICMGYVTAGLWNFNMFKNADWDRAVRKNQEVTKYTSNGASVSSSSESSSSSSSASSKVLVIEPSTKSSWVKVPWSETSSAQLLHSKSGSPKRKSMAPSSISSNSFPA